ncbi:hypothetical protein LTR17_001962 [Elasticomyces elasticus]|nr:hypothetical protein LTR17_001962 [Elasticomyces elasticus]
MQHQRPVQKLLALFAKPGQYEYHAFDNDAHQIRLMTILPDEAGSPIRITLAPANLWNDVRPPYETVSYVWGDPTRSACLKVYKRSKGSRYRYLNVPTNTAAVLNRIRLPDRKRTIWQDAVCINQDDLVERGHQVSLMGKIYSGSMGNIVYLGELSDPTMEDRIPTTITTLLSDAERRTNGFSTFGTTIRDKATGGYRYGQSEMQRTVDQEAVIFMMELPWFRRLWTLQEAALAPKNTVVLGTSQFDLLDMLRALMWWAYGGLPASSMEAQAGILCIRESHAYIDHDQGRMTGRFPGITDLLVCSTAFEKSEPRDGVFAGLSLLSGPPAPLLTPDYNKPVSEILQIATRLALLEKGDLGLLRLVKLRPGDLEGARVASWVLRVDRQYHPAIDSNELNLAFGAAETLVDGTSLTTDSLISAMLLTTGYVVDEVESLSRVCTPADHRFLDTWLIWIREAFNLYRMRVVSRTLPQSRRAFALTFLGGGILNSTSLPATDTELKPLDDFTDLMWNAAEEHIKEDAIIEHPLRAALLDVVHAFRTDYTVNRLFFVTRSGRPGLGSGEMQSGDIVTLLRSVRTPMILRPLSNGHYQLLGEAYIDGIMFGEAWEECKSAGAIEEDFLLV